MKKKGRNRVYVNMLLAQLLYDNNTSARWDDIHLPTQWHLNATRVSVSCEGSVRRNKVSC
jgi:hypothetical protein